jgi:cell division inhibitor SulA
MKGEQLLKSGNATLLLEWVEECTPEEEYASLLDAAEKNTRKNLKLR